MKRNKEFGYLFVLFISVFTTSFFITNGIKFLIYGQSNIPAYSQDNLLAQNVRKDNANQTTKVSVVPTFFCAGSCPTLSPTDPTKTTVSVNPTSASSAPQPTTVSAEQPCAVSNNAIDNASKQEEGLIKQILNFFIELIKKLLQFLGLQSSTPSQPAPLPQNPGINNPVPTQANTPSVPCVPAPTSAPIPTLTLVSQPVLSPVVSIPLVSIIPSGVVPSQTVNNCQPAGPNDPEPPADYKRLSFRGGTVNTRTKVMMETTERYAKSLGVSKPLSVMQGSYSNSVGASAGTHNGGGALDISISGLSQVQQQNYLKAFRMAGFAAWIRTPAEGFPYHIHAEAIGDKELAPLAKTQVQNYFDGKNGLSGGRKDTAPASVGRPVPGWATPKYGVCK